MTAYRTGFRMGLWKDSLGKKLGTAAQTSEIGKEVEQLTYERWIVKKKS